MPNRVPGGDVNQYLADRVEAFGEDVVAHYLNNARIEQAAYDSAITDWERVRGFERF